MFWSKTITLFNKHEDEQTGLVRWHRHLLSNCFVKVTNNKVNIGSVQLQTNNNIIRIPTQSNYLPPYEWLKLPNDIKGKFFTLQGGDLIFLGNVNENIDEYMTGQRSSDLIAKYKSMGSVFISSVNINDFTYGSHYFIRGE